MKSIAKGITLLKQVVEGKIKSNEAKVMQYLLTKDGTNIYEMRNVLRIPHQTLTATISNLMDMGLLKFDGLISIDEETYSVIKYCQNLDEINKVSQSREKEKFVKWLKAGVNIHAEKLDVFVKSELEILIKQYGAKNKN